MEPEQKSKTLNLYPIDYPFETLVARITAIPKPKLILDPDFQRKYKWDKDGWERASKFIESCLMRIPLPSCYLAETDDGRHIVIDGVQRLTTIVRFFKDEFALEGLTTFTQLEGRKFSELGEFRLDLEATTIRCIVLRKENPKKLIREIFSRLNQGAVALSDQEIRHAIYPGRFDDLLRELAQIESIRNFGKGPNSAVEKDSREAEEQVLRFFAFQGDLGKYDDRLSKYLDIFMEDKSDAETVEIDRLRALFIQSLEKCISVFGKDIFKDISKTSRQRQSMVYYDLLMHSLGQLPGELVTNRKEAIRLAFIKLCKDSGFQKTLSGGLQYKGSIERRRQIWAKHLEGALK